MVVVPAATPLTIPVLPTVAVTVDTELQAPPAVASLREVVAPPAHTTAVPDIAAGTAGKEFTVMVSIAVALPQPVNTE